MDLQRIPSRAGRAWLERVLPAEALVRPLRATLGKTSFLFGRRNRKHEQLIIQKMIDSVWPAFPTGLLQQQILGTKVLQRDTSNSARADWLD